MVKESWVIVKKMVIGSREQTIVLLDNFDEILEFHSYEEAKKISDLFENNSDSGWKYSPRKVGK
jgi:hypothetical protein